MALEVGNKVEGKITGLAKFGAFIDLGDNKTGLVHISEVSDKFVEDINDELSVGQIVTVEVLSIGNDGKIALSMRDKEKEKAEKDQARKAEPVKPRATHNNQSSHFGNRRNDNKSFDSLMDDFLKDSETRLSSIRKNTESKRGGRGGRRS